MRGAILVLLGFSIAACEGEPPLDPHQQLEDLFAREWAFRLAEDPLLATYVGQNDTNDRLPSVSAADQARRAEYWRGILDQLQTIDRESLSTTDRINYDMFERQISELIIDIEFRDYEMPLTADSGFHTGFAQLPSSVPLQTPVDYENYIARMHAYPDYVGQQIENMRAGLERGFTLPRVVLEGLDVTIASHVIEDPEDSVFFTPFESFPDTFTETDRERLLQAGIEAIMNGVVPGYEAFLEFMREEYIPGARATLGASALPDGEAYYAHKSKHFTTLDLTPEEIHQIGLSEVARIRGEMMEIIDEVGFYGGFDEFLTFLRTDPRFYAETPEELLKEASYISKRMDGKLPALFKTLPRLPYGVAPVPEHLAPKYTAGRYVPPSKGSTQPGYYWVNTHSLENRPLYALTALSLHEAVPGHHLQFSLAIEQEEQPDFRQYDYISAFGEGWGLYSEYLGVEADMYEDAYSQFGRLTYEMWRAARLVVDTGLHIKGWTREQAMDYLAANTALSLLEVQTETDRYISWPGQALSYKLGELKIKELRRRAESELGGQFDIREFHDAVVLNGSVPLNVLEELVDEYIQSTSSTATTNP